MGDRGKKRKDFGPPPRWLNCPRKGALIVDKFIPFKTPLDENYDSQIPEECSFSPHMMIASLSSYKVKMGLWIDLTNTGRFYNRNVIDGHGIKYLKLQCRGHGECPSLEQTATFIELCQRFISKNPLEVIGIHCTHGFNRTGFLIVAYLVESLSWSVEAAVGCFSQARPPGIYKEDYLLELFKRYGDVDDVTPTPALPEWCNEEDDMPDDGIHFEQNESQNTEYKAPRKKRKEFVKKNATFMEGVPGVTVVENPILGLVQRKCQSMCEWESSGFPGCQPVSMDLNNLNFFHRKPYKVSWKADGTRYMMLIDGEHNNFFIDRDNAVFQISNITFPRRKEPLDHIEDTLLDGEMIIDKVNGNDVPRYLVYDIIKFEGKDVGKTDFDRRLLCINKEIITPRRAAMVDGRIDRCREPFSIRAKDFWDVTSTRLLLGEKFQKNIPHEVDGLIFQPVSDPYISGRCMEVLKWKPPSLNSVDFKLLIKQVKGEGLLPAKIGCLHVGGYDGPFAQIKITKAIKELDKKIIECKFEQGLWVFMRERTDKSFPNSYRTAVGVCSSINEPVTTERLLSYIDQHRWQPTAKPKQTPPVPGQHDVQ